MIKGKNWTIILYKTEEDKRILDYIKYNFEYAYILHDKDVEKTGEIKKAHYHVLFRETTTREINVIAKELNVEINRITKIKSWKAQVQYLIHKNNKDKYKYSIEDIKHNMNENELLEDIEAGYNEMQDMIIILQYIETKEGYVTITEVLNFVLKNNLYASYRRAGNQIIKLIEEHNKLFIKSENKKRKEEIKNEKRNY